MTKIDDSLTIESIILANLVNNEEFGRQVSPYLRPEYFEERSKRILVDEYLNYLRDYNSIPTKEALFLEVETRRDIDSGLLEDVKNDLNEIAAHEEKQSVEWLRKTTEQYCKDRAVYLAITESIGIIDGSDTKRDKNAIPGILADALAVSFDEYIGHDYFENAGDRWEFAHRKEKRHSFDIDWFNRITGGGIPPKTLSAILAGTGVGKSLAMCHMAASFVMAGKNVLYITMEMAEERISERIDANLLNKDISSLVEMEKEVFETKIKNLRERTVGKFIVKEFPTAGAHVGHFRHLIRELKLKKKFSPDIVFVDYINICAAARVRGGESTYTLVKTIAEELRGLAIEEEIAIITATQSNRDGLGASDIDITNTSESIGLPATLDTYVAMISTDQLNAQGQVMFKCLKTRFTDLSAVKPCVVGIERSKMKLFELENNVAQKLNGSTDNIVEIEPKKEKKNKFAGFKI